MAATAKKENVNGSMIVSMTFKKSTPGTHVYGSDDPEAAVTSVYVRKSKMSDPPQAITLTITS